MAIVIAVKYRLKPGKRDELLSFVMDNVKNTRMEPGNLAYSHFPSLEDENEMFVFEMWEELKNVDDHLNQPHYLEFAQKRLPILECYESQTFDASLVRERKKAPWAK